MRWTVQRVHKWMAVTTGAILFVWVVSGVVMILPAPPSPGQRAPHLLPADYERFVVPPAVAVRRAMVARAGGAEARVQEITLRWIGDLLAYDVVFSDAGRSLVDARTGEPFTIDGDRAAVVVQSRRPDLTVAGAELVTGHDWLYPWGPLPVYRVRFDAAAGAVAYVSPLTGAVQHSNRGTRLRAAITSLHDFYAIKVVLDNERVRKGALLAFSALSIAVILSGYYLAVPPRFKRWRQGRP